MKSGFAKSGDTARMSAHAQLAEAFDPSFFLFAGSELCVPVFDEGFQPAVLLLVEVGERFKELQQITKSFVTRRNSWSSDAAAALWAVLCPAFRLPFRLRVFHCFFLPSRKWSGPTPYRPSRAGV
jgi:hypothetical protein